MGKGKKVKSPKPKITKLQESIHLLNTILNSLKSELDSLKIHAQSNIPSEQLATMNQLTFKHGIIQVQSYLDEYRTFFVKELDLGQRKKIEPYYKRISTELQRFPGIRKYRNNALAHSLRTDKKNSIFLHGDFRLYRVPQNLKEYMFVIHCLDALTAIINQHFPRAYDEALEAVKLRLENNKNPYVPMLTDEELITGLEKLRSDLGAIDKTQVKKN